MNRRQVTMAALLVVGLAAGIAQAQGPTGSAQQPKSNEDAVTKALADYDKAIAEAKKEKDKTKSATLRIQAIDLISAYANKDKRVLDALVKVVNTSSEDNNVKGKAADALGVGLVDNPKVQDALSALDHAFSSNEKDEGLAQMILSQLTKANDDAARKGAAKILDKIATPRATKFEDKHAMTIASAAIQTLGSVRVADSVETLMKIYPQVEAGKPAPPDPNDKNPPKQSPEEIEKEAQRTQIEGVINGALTSLTAQSAMQKLDDWKKWWAANKKGWKPQ